MLPRVIGMNGFAGSGKDTVADFFVQNYGYQRISMADAVKDVLSVVYGWDRKMLQGDTPQSRVWREQPDEFWSQQLGYTFTPRLAMQRIGTDLFRNHFNQDIWCMVVKKKIRDLGDRVIIPDCRFLNEMQIFQDFNGDMIEVRRGELPEWYELAAEQNQFEKQGLPYHTRMEDLYPDIHPSEYKWIGVNQYKYLVNNNSTLADLYVTVSKLYQ